MAGRRKAEQGSGYVQQHLASRCQAQQWRGKATLRNAKQWRSIATYCDAKQRQCPAMRGQAGQRQRSAKQSNGIVTL